MMKYVGSKISFEMFLFVFFSVQLSVGLPTGTPVHPAFRELFRYDV